jgi:hypothetical protein
LGSRCSSWRELDTASMDASTLLLLFRLLVDVDVPAGRSPASPRRWPS